MAVSRKTDLLRIPKVRQEIDRYKWIASEYSGYDIGFEKAAKEWIDRYADVWLKHHLRKKT